jgi:hypothetical protein
MLVHYKTILMPYNGTSCINMGICCDNSRIHWEETKLRLQTEQLWGLLLYHAYHEGTSSQN